MIYFILCFTAGICSLQLFSELPSCSFIIISFIGIFFCIVFLFLSFPRRRGSHILKQGLISLFAFLLGFSWIWGQAYFELAKTLPLSLENKPIAIQGVIQSLPEVGERGLRFEFDITHGQSLKDWKNPGKIQVFWPTPSQKPKIGETWEFTVKLKRPRGFSNPGSFDKEKHFFRHRWVAEGIVVNKAGASKISESYFQPINQWRAYIFSDLKRRLHNKKQAGLITALVLGVTSGIDQHQWTVFRETGTSHLMAISGLHVSFIAAFFYFLMNWGWRWARVPFGIPAQWIASLAGLVAALGYALLSGFSLPTQRALIMLSLAASSLLRRRLSAIWRNYTIALGVVLLIDPFAVLMPGFWLSFGAVGIILYGMQGRLHPHDLWWRWGRAQWVAFLGLIPLSIGFFQQFSWISPFTNLLAIPWVTFLVVPTALLGVLLLPLSSFAADGLLGFAEKALDLLFPLLDSASKLPNVSWVSEAVSPLLIGSAMMGVIIFLAPRGFPGRWMGLVWCLPLFIVKVPLVPWGTLRFTLLDVGQGLAAVIETQHHLLVFDTGPKKGSSDTGKQVVLPFLSLHGRQKIDCLIISHGDLDHIGGMASIINKLTVEKILTSEPDKMPGEVKADAVDLCFAGQQWEWDGVKFEMLHPKTFETRKRNDQSCVLRVSTEKQSVLLTGDIEAKSELTIIDQAKEVKASVLVVPHHGSRSSSSEAFIKAVDPLYALIPVGHQNPYGHPRIEVVKRYESLGVRLLDTVRDGAITFVLKNEETLEPPVLYRQTNRRFWMGEFRVY